jgi:putative hemolysin
MSAEKFLDVRKAIQKKNPKLLKWLPEFVINYIRRVIHEDDLNSIMQRHNQLEGLDFIDVLIEEFGIQVELKGADNIPLDKSVIFAANHPIGGMDGIVFMHALGKYRQDIKFLVNDILTNIENLNSLFVPINKHGSQRRRGTATIDEAYSSDYAILVFPAGLVSRKQNGIIRDLEWKKSFISKSKKHQKDIVPVFIEGRNSDFFYNFARLRKWLGIKANLEMFYLPKEMFAQRGKKVTIHIGKPISYDYFDGSKSEKEWAAEVRDVVYRMMRTTK